MIKNIEDEHISDEQDLNTEGGMEKMEAADGFVAMEEDDRGGVGVGLEAAGEREGLWPIDSDSIFYNEFPPLPDFPCMSSSSSSSSSAPLVAKPISAGVAAASSCSSPASSSPDTSYTVMKSDAEEDTGMRSLRQFDGSDEVGAVEAAVLSSTASMEIPPGSGGKHDGLGIIDCIDVMENFGYMDLLEDSNEIWDPSSIFQNDDNLQEQLLEDPSAAAEGSRQGQEMQCEEEPIDGGLGGLLQGNSELSVIFFEWLKKNKDCISAEDVRSIKLKRSTIESASKRLGNTKEGRKQLLKLILDWVGQFQLQKKRMREGFPCPEISQFNPIPNPNSNLNCITPYSDTSPWIPPPPPVQISDAAIGPPMECCNGGGYHYASHIPVNPLSNQVVNGIPFPPSADYSMMNHAQSWAPPPPPPPFAMLPNLQFSHFPDNSGTGFPHHQQAVYGNPYQMFDQNGERLVRLGSSATKEARKNRMARQRRLYSHHNRHGSSSNQHQNHMNDDEQHMGGEDCEMDCSQNNPWGYWSSGSSSSPSTVGMISPANAPELPPEDHSVQNYQRQASADRRQQLLKTEKNLKFLLQKVLKQSDVGNLGRIVLPKKEAESHLPELESRDGIPIAMEDIGTSRVWNMRYRFWPNNKSRMYLLENTGDFVRVNGLQEGDFIVIYSDTKCGRYMIRGVKVRQPGSKLDAKKPAARRNMRNVSITGSSSSSAPIKQAVR